MQEKIIKVIPGLLFLFCILEVFEMVLIINDMNQTEKLEREVKKNLEMIETIAELLNDHLECMQLENHKIKLK
ncbi:hypothetical protein HPY499_07375 [Helicobacter pylori]|uniref:hypothetical protein n=1 Tax=Helicobacter pylori TaxID=210 RepID=UPI0005732857|nr:hypothetical protein [Helicobacter pylori]KHL89695.1 hypothetical protein HPY499_07375 [Helicobacter pylori]